MTQILRYHEHELIITMLISWKIEKNNVTAFNKGNKVQFQK